MRYLLFIFVQVEESKQGEEVKQDIVTRLTDEDHLKEVFVKKEIMSEPVRQEVEEQQTSQQEAKEPSLQEAMEPSLQEVVQEPEEEVAKDDGNVQDEKESLEEGYVLYTRAGETEPKTQQEVSREYLGLNSRKSDFVACEQQKRRPACASFAIYMGESFQD